MKIDLASRTAHLVTLGRALADAGLSHVPDFHDPTALVFLTAKGKRAVERSRRAAEGNKRNTRVEMARVMADMIALRTAAIDSSVRDALAGGAKQLVILGAGYDGRAWRMPELRNVKVFEVDRPAIQGNKRAHLSELPAAAGNVTFVSMDFRLESLGSALDHAGHDRSSPTCWIWEGVVMYLTRDVMRATLSQIASRSARGSTLIVNYHSAPPRLVARVMFWLIGEPQISTWTPEEMAADLRSARLKVLEDSNMADWNRRFADGKARVDRAPYMRIAVARN